MQQEDAELLLSVGLFLLFTVGPILFSWIFGNIYQKKKQEELGARVKAFGTDNLTTLKTPPAQVSESGLLTANIIMSVSWWQKLLGGLKTIFGGQIRSWDGILDWARKEAMQRLREQASAKGFDNVINVRLETSEIQSSKGRNTAIEILAYGTGIKV
ncbi:MAG: heavy metal-binding domain-containing protein [Euryarchaeota archaeon]|mgnify:CR=1 FL=1|jgi:uncharacterized protein YbjQ (UPF0145 family)|nr:heavy metal-binding domain-containing protein [Euryarchaeota archaeon]MBT7938239.1 heavy metal-binding domain-containing protein [Euryarchaeota archaeon]